MATVQDILDFLEGIAPSYMKMDWDHIGLLCGSRSKVVRKVLVALDPFEHVCREAAETGADLLLTHHPLIFRPLEAVTDERAVTRGLMTLCAYGISAVNAHTNLDCAPGGVNDVLAAALGLGEVEVIDPSGTDAQGRPWGLLHKGLVDEQPLEGFLSTVKASLHTPVLRYADGGRPVRCVAVGGGNCVGGMREAAAAGCDTFVTADAKYNDFWDARDLGLSLIDAGHFYTENPVCAVLAAQLREAFPQLTVELSRTHADCSRYF